MKKFLAKFNININYFDYFALLNSFFFLLMCYFVYYARFIDYRGASNIYEFFIYATVILLIVFFSWHNLRSHNIRLSILLLIEIGVLMHFAGAFVEVDGHRLYDSRFFDIRYDKYVHFANAMIATFVTLCLLAKNEFPQTKFTLLIAVLIVLGLGGINEIIEFIVTITVEHNGVGAYNNNMLDLVANLFGAITAVLLYEYFLKNYILNFNK